MLTQHLGEVINNNNTPKLKFCLAEWTSKRYLNRALLSWIQQPDGSLKVWYFEKFHFITLEIILCISKF